MRWSRLCGPMQKSNSVLLDRCMLTLSGTRLLDSACRLVTDSAASLVCHAASALLKLQKEARAAEQQ